MKRVWILNHYAQEPSRPGGTRHFMLARHLTQFGWEASIIGASVELNTGRQRLAPGEAHRLDICEGVPFLWIRTPPYEGNGIGRIANMMTYSLRSLFVGRCLPRPNAIIGSSVHPFAALSGWLLARRYGVPFVFEVRDLWPETLIDLGRLDAKSWTARILRRLEGFLYARAVATVVLLPRAWEYIVRFGVPSSRVVWIPNGVDVGRFPASPGRAHPRPFTFMYFGAHGEANGLDNVIDAFHIAAARSEPGQIQLRIVGDGPLKATLIDRARRLGALGSIAFEDPVPKNAVPALAAAADAFVFNLVDAPVFKYGISSNKLFDFMAGARPVIFCCASGNNPVDDAQAGLTVTPGNPVELADAMLRIVALPSQERIDMGWRGRHYVEREHGFTTLSKRLARVLDDACCPQSKSVLPGAAND